MAYSFAASDAPSTRRTQYFELHGNRAIYNDGWVAACGPLELPWAFKMPPPERDDVPWELYDIESDFSQAHDLAAEHPDRLRDLQDLFWVEASANNVLPLVPGTARRVGPPVPSAVAGRTSFTFHPGTTRVPPASAPDPVNRSYTVSADVEVGEGASGFLFGQGGRFGGHALYLVDGELRYHYNLLGTAAWTVSGGVAVPAGRHELAVAFEREGDGFGEGGTVTLRVDGAVVATQTLPRTTPWRMSYIEGLNVGRDTGTPVSPDYAVPYAFTGTLHTVRMELG
jgi:arylsulfatase